MKVVISILLSVGIALCEVPPPYPPRGFRPSPPFNLPIRQPQTSYGVPETAPSKLSQASPQVQYGSPNQQGPSSSPNLTPNFSSKQTIPSTSYGVPVTTTPYRTIISQSQAGNSISNQQLPRPVPSVTPNFNSKQTVPNIAYGSPVTSSPYRTIINEPQVAFNANSQNRPSTQYGVPDSGNVETLEQIRQLNLLLQLSQSQKSNQQKQTDINLAQSQNANRNVGIPSQQYLPAREAANFRGDAQSQTSQRNTAGPAQGYLPAQEPTNFGNAFNLPQANNQDSFDVRIPNPNLQKLSQQYLPVKEASNFDKGVEYPQTAVHQNQNVQPNVNYQQPINNNPQLFNQAASSQNRPTGFNQQYPSNINPNLAVAPQNINPNLNSYEAPLQGNVDIQQLNVKRLQNPNNAQNSVRQNAGQPFQPVQQNREFGDSNIQGASREQVDERYLPPTTTVRSTLRPNSGAAPLPKDNSSDEDEQSTESKEEAGGPNIAVATAVSGVPGGQSFYLLQPDGRLQRVIYQKTRAEGDRENEYTANYLFQNIQADPNLVYSPLVALGKR